MPMWISIIHYQGGLCIMKLKLLQLGMQVKKRSPMVMFMGLVAINTKRILSYDLFLLFKARVHYLGTYWLVVIRFPMFTESTRKN